MSTWKALKSWKNTEYLIQNTTNKKIPIETSSYTNFETKLISFQNYIQDKYPLFEDFENLKNDFEIPKYCKAGVGDIYRINAWMGPKNTISNLHYDPNPNLIYDKKDSKFMYRHKHFRLKNTSQINLDKKVDVEKFPGFDSLEYWEFEINEGEMLFIPQICWSGSVALTMWIFTTVETNNSTLIPLSISITPEFYEKTVGVTTGTPFPDVFQFDTAGEPLTEFNPFLREYPVNRNITQVCFNTVICKVRDREVCESKTPKTDCFNLSQEFTSYFYVYYTVIGFNGVHHDSTSYMMDFSINNQTNRQSYLIYDVSISQKIQTFKNDAYRIYTGQNGEPINLQPGYSGQNGFNQFSQQNFNSPQWNPSVGNQNNQQRFVDQYGRLYIRNEYSQPINKHRISIKASKIPNKTTLQDMNKET
eukprot:gene10775-3394_t